MIGFVYYGAASEIRIVERRTIVARIAAHRLAVKAARAAPLSIGHHAEAVAVRDARQKLVLDFPVQEVALKCDP